MPCKFCIVLLAVNKSGHLKWYESRVWESDPKPGWRKLSFKNNVASWLSAAPVCNEIDINQLQMRTI